jgi:hypothetical protein
VEQLGDSAESSAYNHTSTSDLASSVEYVETEQRFDDDRHETGRPNKPLKWLTLLERGPN